MMRVVRRNRVYLLREIKDNFMNGDNKFNKNAGQSGQGQQKSGHQQNPAQQGQQQGQNMPKSGQQSGQQSGQGQQKDQQQPREGNSLDKE